MNTQTYYDEISSGYDELHGVEQRNKLAIIKKFISSKKKILDIGSGTGISSEFFENIVGLEPSSKMIEEGQKKREYFAICDCAENLSVHFKENEFDAVICVSSAHHFKDPALVFSSVQKVCKQKGEVVLTFLRRATKTEELVGLAKNFFLCVKEIVEDKDIILILVNQKNK